MRSLAPGRANRHDRESDETRVDGPAVATPHWGWLPAGAFSAWLAWERYGAFMSIGLVALSLGAGIWAEHRARRRRDDEDAARRP